MKSAVRWLFALLWVCICGASCAQRSMPPPDDSSKLRGITTLYAIATRDSGRPPQTIDQLTRVLEAATSDPEAALRSTRDGQLFVIVWGVDLAGQQGQSDMVLAYERTGRNGSRMAVTCRGDVREVTSEHFSQLTFPNGHRPEWP